MKVKITLDKIEKIIVEDAEIKKVFKEVSNNLIKAGIPININNIKKVGAYKTRSACKLGVTITRFETAFAPVSYYIGINKSMMNNAFQAHKTMAHELVHTIAGCNNHGVNFKHYAKIVNKVYPEYNVRTFETFETLEPKEQFANSTLVEKSAPYGIKFTDEKKEKTVAPVSFSGRKPKYVVTCQDCGTKSYFFRNCKTLEMLENTKRCTCKKCKCHNFIVESVK